MIIDVVKQITKLTCNIMPLIEIALYVITTLQRVLNTKHILTENSHNHENWYLVRFETNVL